MKMKLVKCLCKFTLHHLYLNKHRLNMLPLAAVNISLDITYRSDGDRGPTCSYINPCKKETVSKFFARIVLCARFELNFFMSLTSI